MLLRAAAQVTDDVIRSPISLWYSLSGTRVPLRFLRARRNSEAVEGVF